MDLIRQMPTGQSQLTGLNPYSNGREKPSWDLERGLTFCNRGWSEATPSAPRTPSRIEPRRGSTTSPLFDLSEVGGRRSDHTSAGVASLHQTVTYLGRFHRPSCPTDSRLFPCFNGAMNLINSSLTHWNNLIYVLILILMEQCIWSDS